MNVYIIINLVIMFVGVAVSTFIYHTLSKRQPSLLKKIGYDNAEKNDQCKKDLSNNYIFYLLIGLMLVFITTFRSPDNGASIDYGTYLKYSNQLNDIGIIKSISYSAKIQTEPGLAVLMSVLSNILPGTIIALILVTTTAVVVIYMTRFRRDSKIVWLSTLMLVSFGSFYVLFNAIGQYFAITLTFALAGFLFYKDRNRKNIITYILCILLCALIHKSVLLMIPAYFVLTHRFQLRNRRDVIYLALLSLTILFFYFNTDYIINIGISTLFPEYLTFLRNEVPFITSGSITNMLRPSLLILFLLLNRRYINTSDRRISVGINATIIFFVINLFATKVELIQRFSYLFIPYIIILIPNIIAKMPQRNRNIWIAICTIIFILFGFISMMITDEPYFKFLWQ